MKRLQVLLAVALATLPVSCGENETVAPDETPPGRVTDLMVKSAKPNVITLRWTTPGDNGRQGTATSYQVRWSTDWITESNFDRANKIPDPPVPGAPGSVELFSVPNMDITRVIHFALRTMDEVGLVSPVSNDARWTPAGFPVQYYKDLPALKDNTLYSEAGTLSNGAGQYLFAGRTASGVTRRALLAFAVSDSVPATAVIDSVRLTLHMSSATTGARPVQLHVLTADWGEGVSNAPGEEENGVQAEANDATWGFRFFDTTAWTLTGGDFRAESSEETAVGAPNVYTWSSTLMRDDVQRWLEVPDSNFGWALIGDETGSISVKRFNSSEYSPVAYRPNLKIYYTLIP